VREVSLSKAKPALLAVFEPVKVTYSSPPTGPVAGRSFPSGHAMNNSVLATLAILFFGRFGMWYIIPAAIVSYSRIYTGSHWASDVVVSCILGVGFALLSASFFTIAYQLLAPRFFPRLYAKHPALFDRLPE
ncbi:MAG: phosphatase PAP2 family protein, partial [Verrucomicrobia bacterium]|nr:phosphatase PAP2 family protein [Verrucomicrobiota bacterium]